MMTVVKTCSMPVFNDHYLVNHSAVLNAHTALMCNIDNIAMCLLCCELPWARKGPTAGL